MKESPTTLLWQKEASGVNKDYAIGGWLFGCGAWLFGGVLKELGIPWVFWEECRHHSAVIGTTLILIQKMLSITANYM